jgi:thiol:disulfide interchange protein DsbA
MLRRTITALLLLIPALVLGAEFVEGKDYRIIQSDQKNVRAQKPVVAEFFSYGCPSCFRVETPVTDWMKKIGNSVVFERFPVVFKPEWELYAKAYYTVKILALSDEINAVLFKTIQVDKNPLNSNQAMIDFFMSQGVDKEIAQSAFEHSPTIDMRVHEGMTLMAKYEVNAVPSFIVNQKYQTDLQKAGSPERLVEILDYLVRIG